MSNQPHVSIMLNMEEKFFFSTLNMSYLGIYL